MRLALMLLRSKTNPNGHMYRGKHRKIKPVFIEDLQKLRNAYAIEEENMFYLRHPYLTSVSDHFKTYITFMLKYVQNKK